MLLAETALTKVTEQELQGLAKRHGSERLLQASDIAAETWRRTTKDIPNPAGYINTLCTTLVVPDWYVPYEERKAAAKESQRKKEERKVEQVARKAKEDAETAASEALWQSLPGEQREEYLAQVRASLPAGIEPPMSVLVAMARSSIQPCRQ